jgi:hypothetical protein
VQSKKQKFIFSGVKIGQFGVKEGKFDTQLMLRKSEENSLA